MATWDSQFSTKKQDLEVERYLQAAKLRRDKLRRTHLTVHEDSVRLAEQDNARYERLSLESQLEAFEQQEQIRKAKLKLNQIARKAAALSEARRNVRFRVAQQDMKLNQSLHLSQCLESSTRPGALSVDLDRYSDEDDYLTATQPTTSKQEPKYVLIQREGDDVLKMHILGEAPKRRPARKRKPGKTVRFEEESGVKSVSPEPRFQRLWGLVKPYQSRRQSPSPPPQRHEIVGRMKNYYDNRVKAVFSPTIHQAKVIQNQLRKEPTVVHRAFHRVALGLVGNK